MCPDEISDQGDATRCPSREGFFTFDIIISRVHAPKIGCAFDRRRTYRDGEDGDC